MSRAKVFESILVSKFRFPQFDDEPFIESADYCQNADISPFRDLRLHSMILGYKEGADLVVDRALNDDRSSIDLLIYPIIFCYRHFIELSLKQLINLYGKDVRDQSIWKTHNLSELWKKVKDVINEYSIEDVDDSTSVVTNIIDEFENLDPGSSSFRYPVDKNGNPIELEQEVFDLENLADVMNGFEVYIEFLDGNKDHRTRCAASCRTHPNATAASAP